MSLIDLTKHYLAWRDETIRALAEERARLQLGEEILRPAEQVIGRSCDASLVKMVKEFDRRCRELQERLDAERTKLAHLALHDPLTGLANRTLLLDRLGHALAQLERSPRSAPEVAVIFCDLDGFKAGNDTLGHDAGDRLLIAIAEALTGGIRSSDTVARLGDDEFVLVCEALDGGQAELDALVARIQAAIAACSAPLGDLAVSASIGTTTVTTGGADPEQVIARADAAMYAAKQQRVSHITRPPALPASRRLGAPGPAEGCRSQSTLTGSSPGGTRCSGP